MRNDTRDNGSLSGRLFEDQDAIRRLITAGLTKVRPTRQTLNETALIMLSLRNKYPWNRGLDCPPDGRLLLQRTNNCYTIMRNIKDKLYVATFSERYRETIKHFGVGMEINHTCISHLLDEEEDKRAKLLRSIEKDIELSSPSNVMIHGPFTEIIPAAIDPKMRELGLIRVNQAYDVAAHFGLKKMVVHNGWMPFMYFKSYQADKGAEFWQEFMKDKEQDFILAVENVLEDEPEMIKDMMEKIEDSRIKICLDVGHANATTTSDYNVFDWLKILGPYITHFHLHNNDGSGDTHSAFDEGTLDMREVLLAIEDLCPEDVTYTIEARKAYECLEWLGARGFI